MAVRTPNSRRFRSPVCTEVGVLVVRRFGSSELSWIAKIPTATDWT
jgi:hypothetical protein